ncbi:MAG: helix-turn-helix domain-containing protein [Clostridiales bacterium]|jgi:transcriptional regulator with XRE-family HTH domain|nr:helix-turn-helix domain-containing protein [Clostridiales bacterium]
MLGSNLKRLRREKRLTQDELARLTGVSTSAISMYEQGRREPDYKTLAALADIFQVSTDRLLGRGAVTNQGEESAKGDRREPPDDALAEEFVLLCREAGYLPPEERQELLEDYRRTLGLFLRTVKSRRDEGGAQ